MAFRVKHEFSSPKSDGGDATLVRPSNWNADHTIEMNAGKVMGRDNSGDGDAQELPLSFDTDGNPDFDEAAGALGLPSGTTGERPGVPRDGHIRYNETLEAIEAYVASAWQQFLTSTIASTLTMNGAAINEAARVNVASAAVTDLGAADSNYVRVTGTVTITGLGTVASGTRRHVVFAGVLILTHDATALILPNAGSNITTAAGDTAFFESEGSGNWRCLHYQRANGTPLALPAAQQRAYAYVTLSGATLTTQKSSGFTSITRTATGKFTCTMSSAMPDANYRVMVTSRSDPTVTTNAPMSFERTGAGRSTTVFYLGTLGDNVGYQDPDALNIEVFA